MRIFSPFPPVKLTLCIRNTYFNVKVIYNQSVFVSTFANMRRWKWVCLETLLHPNKYSQFRSINVTWLVKPFKGINHKQNYISLLNEVKEGRFPLTEMTWVKFTKLDLAPAGREGIKQVWKLYGFLKPIWHKCASTQQIYTHGSPDNVSNLFQWELEYPGIRATNSLRLLE